MKTLIMIKDDEVKVYNVEDEQWAKYQLQRRIEKENWVAEQAFLVDESQALPCKEWVREYEDKIAKIQLKIREAEEKAQFEYLKKKFEK